MVGLILPKCQRNVAHDSTRKLTGKADLLLFQDMVSENE